MLVAWGKERNREVLDKLLPVIYAELQKQAHRYLRRERNQHSIQTTELINEAYVKLVGQKQLRIQNRKHFFAISANLMREILVDRARRRGRTKRGGALVDLELREDIYTIAEQDNLDLLALDEALSRLAAFDLQQARVVEMKFFGGLEITEIAEALSVSTATVKRDWNSAKVWLRHELSRPVHDPGHDTSSENA
jgi:RNA polymerase sigma factor (TIGR02999 family)